MVSGTIRERSAEVGQKEKKVSAHRPIACGDFDTNFLFVPAIGGLWGRQRDLQPNLPLKACLSICRLKPEDLHMQRTTTSVLDQSAVHLLHRTSQHASDAFAKTVGYRHHVTARQLAVLTAISEVEGLNQTQIVHRTGIDRSTLADIVRRMLRKGLLERRRTKENARAYAVRLSEAGRDLLAEVAPLAAEVDNKLFAHLPEGERESFLAMLSTIAGSSEWADSRPSPEGTHP